MKTENLTYNTPALGCLLGRANQVLLKELEKALKTARLPLTATEYLVLRALYCKDGIQQCEIAGMVGRDKAGICRCITGLTGKGLVRTEPASYKCLRVYLTDKARAIHGDVIKVAELRHQALVDLTTSDELAVFNKVIEKIIKNKSQK